MIAAILVVAAAAAMLSVHLVDRQPAAPVAAVALVPAAGTSSDHPIAASSAAPAASGPVAREDKGEPIEAAVAAFTVRVLPLRNEVKNPAGKGVVASMYAAFLDRLSAVPGVTLLAADAGAAGSQAADYQVTITSEEGDWGSDNGRQFGGEFQADILLPTGAIRGSSYSSYMVEVAPGCVTDPRAAGLEVGMIACWDADGVAAELVGRLRKAVFPPDPTLRRELQARLVDRSLGMQQRQQALLDLAYFGGVNGGRKALTEPNKTLRDPAVIRGAVELATTANDPKTRALVWSVLRGTGSANLIPPLLAALGRDADGGVRLAALGALAAEFRGDPRVQAALKSAAERDARPMVRVLAQRAASGPDAEAEWKQYIVASLKDSGRPAAERIEALLYQMNLLIGAGVQANAPLNIGPTLGMLDDDAIRMLAEVLPAAAAESSILQQSANQLVSNLGYVGSPVTTDLLLAILSDGSTSLSRPTATEALGTAAHRQNDSRAYAMLERLGAGDPDPRVRQIAADALKARSSMPPAGKPQRLGINVSVMESGPDVPEDMVGRHVVLGVGPGTVAQRAGMMEQDVLLEINGTPVAGGANIIGIVEALPKGVDIEVLVYRSGQRTRLIARF